MIVARDPRNNTYYSKQCMTFAQFENYIHMVKPPYNTHNIKIVNIDSKKLYFCRKLNKNIDHYLVHLYFENYRK